MWESVDWSGLRRALANTDWNSVLTGDMHLQELQRNFVSNKILSSNPSDQPWFGPRCKTASDTKYRAWIRYKRQTTTRNKQLHREAAVQLQRVQRWAKQHWELATKRKLKGQVSSKLWWKIIKEQQGDTREHAIPPRNLLNGSVAVKTRDKINALAKHFAAKMTMPSPQQQPPQVPILTDKKLRSVTTTQSEVLSFSVGWKIRKLQGLMALAHGCFVGAPRNW